MSRALQLLFVLHCSMIVACGGSSAASCALDEDCESGFCKADGTCGTAPVDAGTDDAPPDGISELCAPNHDGQISLAELPLIAGRMANFRMAANATFDTAGTANPDGSRSWDLTAALAGDADHVVALASPTGAWWAPSFPTATYAVTLAQGSDLLGVFRVDATAVTLLGVVSPEAGSFRTELAYDPAATILALPFAVGATWSSTSTISGVAQGVITAYTERYASRADHVGTMTTPYGVFPVVRVATDLTRTAGLATLLTKRTFAWTAECFGSVATVSSQDFETAAEFTDPAEVRRLAP
ncbi:MAG: hypothetical protein ABI867_11260 [Kofleriaceae bacterium]